jgi:hypothetical protein
LGCIGDINHMESLRNLKKPFHNIYPTDLHALTSIWKTFIRQDCAGHRLALS